MLLILLLTTWLLQTSTPASVTPPATAVSTRVTVRVVARDAKLLYDAVGGARITITDTASGAVLAEGVQRGNSGNTDRIVVTPRARGVAVYDTPGAAAFVADLALVKPTVVTITGEGPLSPAHASMRASKTLLLMPGEHIGGDGVVLEVHGLIVNVNAPPSVESANPIRIAANIEMMCGCPTSPGGTWDANAMTLTATVRDGARVVARAPLAYAGRTSTFLATLEPLPPGAYEIDVTAAAPVSANFGMETRALVVRDEPGIRTEEVTYPADDISVAATLFLPDGQGPFGAVVVAHGSEAGSRNHAGKRRAAERLARQGIAVLLPDKRGVGHSTGTYVETEWLDVLSRDQLAGVRYLKGRADIARDAVGVMGSSQGGWVSQISAASGEAAFAVSISGPGVSPLEQVVAQRINERLEDGMSEADAAELASWWQELWMYYGTGAGYERVLARAGGLPDKPWFARARQGALPAPDRVKGADFEFYRKLVAYDPAPTLARIQVPFLAIFGEKDRHIPMPESADATRAALLRSGNARAEVRVFPGAGHGIQPVDGIERLLGPRTPQAPLPEYLAFVDAWISRAAAARPPTALQEIGDGIYALIRTEPSGLAVYANNVFIVTDEDVVVVDTDISPAVTRNAIEQLRRITDKPVSLVINTHWHDDHYLGNSAYREAYPDVEFLSHASAPADLAGIGATNRVTMIQQVPPMVQALRDGLAKGVNLNGQPLSPEARAAHEADVRWGERYVADVPRSEVVAPTVTIDSVWRRQRGGRTIEVIPVGPAHTPADLIVHLPEDRIVVTGDLIMHPVPLLGFSHPAGWVRALDRVKALNPRVIVPGHGPLLTDETYLDLTRSFLDFLATRASALVAEGRTEQDAMKQIDLREWRTRFAGDSTHREFMFDFYTGGLGIAAAMKEAADRAALIPRAKLFVNRDTTTVQLSPAGAHVGWIDLAQPGRALKVLPLQPRGSDAATVADSVLAWQWLHGGHDMLAVVRTAEGQQLRRIRLDGAPSPLVTGAGVIIVATGPDAPDEAILRVRGVTGTPDGFARLDLTTGGLQPMPELEGYAAAYFDGGLRAVAAQRIAPTTTVFDRRTADGTWVPFLTTGVVDAVSAGIVAVARDGSHITYTSNEHSDTTRLEELDVATGTRRVLAHDPEADILRVGATLDPADGRVQAVVAYHVRMRRHVLNPALTPHFDHLTTAGRGEVSVGSQSTDNSRWLVRFFDGGPARLAIYEPATRAVTPLFAEVPGLDDVEMAPRHALELNARDGLTLRADLYLPPGTDADGDGIPDRPLPTLVFVHGGPWVGFEWNIWEINRHFQLLTNRGYAVIRASFRGEPGFGKTFVDAGDRQWGGAMMTDIRDIAVFAVSRGIADPGRTGIFGWSFGGMAAAHLLASASDQFRCGMSLYGVFDLPAFLETPFAQNDFWRQRVGDVRDENERRRLTAESPLTMANAITRPLLITHGAADERVPIAQSDALADALAALERPATYLVFPDEGHDYYAPQTWMAFWAVAERFLADHLGGRFEVLGDELRETKVEIRSGGGGVPQAR